MALPPILDTMQGARYTTTYHAPCTVGYTCVDVKVRLSAVSSSLSPCGLPARATIARPVSLLSGTGQNLVSPRVFPGPIPSGGTPRFSQARRREAPLALQVSASSRQGALARRAASPAHWGGVVRLCQ